MRRTIEGITIELDDGLCAAFERKFSYPITEQECAFYASGTFHLPFDQVKKRYSPKEIAGAVEYAIKEELPV
jgi:hypothetical protein